MSNTLVDLIESRATHLGDTVAYFHLRDGVQPESPTTYAQLAARAQHLAAELQARRLEGERVLLLYPAGPEFVVGFFGCLLAGAIGVPAPPPEANRHPRSSARLRAIVQDCQARLILSDGSVAPEHSAESLDSPIPMPALDSTHFAGEGAALWRRPAVAPRDVAYLQYTSGSTSTPKGIKVTHDNLVFHLAHLQHICRYTPESVTVTWMPNFHDWGLVEGLLEPFFNGTPCYVMAPFSFVRRPANWLRSISQFRGTHTQGPSFAYEHCLRRFRASDFEEMDLTCWQSAGIAAEPINFPVMQEFHRTFAPYGFAWNTFCPAFGLGEATLMMSCCSPGEPPRALPLDPAALEQNRVAERSSDGAASSVRTVVSCGRLHRETIVRIVEPSTGARLPDREVGEIWIKDRAVAAGYWQRESESAEVFEASIRETGEGPFLRTGDLGFLAEGELFVTGRLKDLIIIRGSNHYPQDIEWTVQRLDPAFAGQTSAAFSIIEDDVERLVIVQEIDRARRPDAELQSLLARIVERVVENHEIEVHRVLLVERGTIPKTASGKTQRRATREAYLHGALEAAAVWGRRSDQRAAGDSEAAEKTTLSLDGRANTDAADDESRGKADRLVAWLRDFARRRVNSQLMDQRRMVSPHVLLELGNHGLFGMQTPTKYGGLDLRTPDVLRVLEQLAAIDLSLATLVFLSNTNGLLPIVKHASEETKAKILPGLAAGRQLAAFALSEPGAGANIGAMEAVAIRQPGGGWNLRGTKRWNGSAWASWVTVIAREAEPNGSRESISAFLVATDQPGVRIGEEALTVGLRSIVQNALLLDDVSLSPTDRLGGPGNGLRVANEALAVGRLCVGAVCLGAAKRALQLVDRYAQRRVIATGTLSEHPYTISVCQQAWLELAGLEAILRRLAAAADADADAKEPNLDWQAMVVKVLASEFLNRFAGQAVQLLGGRGFMENNEVGRIFRDAKALSIGEGPNESLLGYLGQAPQRARIERWLTQEGLGDTGGRFAATCQEIFARCRRLESLTPAQRDQWAAHWAGQVALAATRQAWIARDATTLRVVGAWAEAELTQIMATSLTAAELGPGPIPTSELRGEMTRLCHAIGDLHQELPGEDAALDAYLRPEPNAAATPIPGEAAAEPRSARRATGENKCEPPEPSTPEGLLASRAQLEKLLRARLQPDEFPRT